MANKKIPVYLERVGKKIINGLKKIARDNGIKLKIDGLPALIHFSFEYGNDSQAIMTFFTQEMLKRGILASGGVYVSYAIKEEHVKKYLKNVNEVFTLLKRPINEKKVYNLLEGPVVHVGFKRLT